MSYSDSDGYAALVPGRRRPAAVRLLAAIIRYWALAGGLLIAGLAVMTALSAVSNILMSRPFSADYELMKHFVAIAIFAFLPYCQLSGANVTVDIFTERMGARVKSAMSAFSSIFAIAFSLLLLVQMTRGMQSYIRYPEVTPVLGLPLWTAFPPILLSLVLLLIAALLTLWDGIDRIRRGDASARPRLPVE